MNELVKIEKLVFGGQGLGRVGNKIALIWNALSEEEVEIRIFKKRKNLIEGVAEKINKPSLSRLEAHEPHFLSCSPWQILSFREENDWKQKIAKEVYTKIGGLKDDFNLEIISDEDNQYHYRNKIEYSFVANEKGEISFAFFNRGGHRLTGIKDCELSSEAVNYAAHQILDWLNRNSVPAEILKTLILRSNNLGKAIAALFIKDDFEFKNLPELSNDFTGFHVYYSNPKCPASNPDKLLVSLGNDFLINKINETELKFGLLSFFQVNVPIFEKALEEISNHVPEDSSLIDYYAGVGAISLPIAKKCRDCVLVESNEDAVKYANENIVLNNIKNCKANLVPAEKMIDIISHEKIIILDPPRTGLHNKVIKKILAEQPTELIYLSCNLSTQARDIALLKDSYDIKLLKLFNFFPRTPHIEGLCVLDRKSRTF